MFDLPEEERQQFGQSKGDYSYVDEEKWPELRQMLLERSQKSNPALDPELTAYTPGETVQLMQNPTIQQWHEKVSSFRVPEGFDTVAFVPCAKGKPWKISEGVVKSPLYRAYNEIMQQGGKRPYFVTISEPLGIVPEDFWSDFPQYDNPGLFRDDSQRSGMFTRDWADTSFGQKQIVPFGEEAYQSAINQLSQVIASFMAANADKKFISFVENKPYSPNVTNSTGTHSEMLTRANELVGNQSLPEHHRFLKRPAPRTSPRDYILEQYRSSLAKHILAWEKFGQYHNVDEALKGSTI